MIEIVEFKNPINLQYNHPIPVYIIIKHIWITEFYQKLFFSNDQSF